MRNALLVGLLGLAAAAPPSPSPLAWSTRPLPAEYDLVGKASIPEGGEIRILFEAQGESDGFFLDVSGAAARLGEIGPGGEKPLAQGPGVAGGAGFWVKRLGGALAARVGGAVLRAPAAPRRAGRFGARSRGGAALTDLRLAPRERPVFADDFRREPDDASDFHPVSGTWGVEPSPEADLNANPFRLAARAPGGDALALAGAPGPTAAWSGYAARAAVRPTGGTAGAGIAFYAGDARNLWTFRVRGGKAEIAARLDGAERVVAQAPAALAEGEWTEMLVAVREDECRAFLDDTEVLSARDPSLFAGRAGLWAEGAGPTWFDDFEVLGFAGAEGVPEIREELAWRRRLRFTAVPGYDLAATGGAERGPEPALHAAFEFVPLAAGGSALRCRTLLFGPARILLAPVPRAGPAFRGRVEPPREAGWSAEAGFEADAGAGRVGVRIETPAAGGAARAALVVDGKEAAAADLPDGTAGARPLWFEAADGTVRLRDGEREILSAAAKAPSPARVYLERAFAGSPPFVPIPAGEGFAEYDFLDAPADWVARPGRIGTVNQYSCQPDLNYFGIDPDPCAFAWNKRAVGGDFDIEVVASPQTRVRTGQVLDLPYGVDLCLAREGKGPGSGYDFLFFGPDGPIEIRREGRLLASAHPPGDRPRPDQHTAYELLTDWHSLRIRRSGNRLAFSATGSGARTAGRRPAAPADPWSCGCEDPEPIPEGRLGVGTAGGMVKLSRVRVSARRLGPRTPVRFEGAPPASADLRVVAGGGPLPGPAPSPPSDPVPGAAPPAPGAAGRRSFRSGLEGVEGDAGVEGAVVELVERTDRPGDRAIRLRCPSPGGSLGARLLAGPVDPARYPRIRLEYRIPPGVCADLYAVAGADAARIPLSDVDPLFDGTWSRGGEADSRGPPAVRDGAWREIALPIPAEVRGRPAVYDRIVIKDAGVRVNRAGAWLELDEISLVPRALLGAEAADAQPPRIEAPAAEAAGFPLAVAVSDAGSGVDSASLVWRMDGREERPEGGAVRYDRARGVALYDPRPRGATLRAGELAASLSVADLKGNRATWEGTFRIRADGAPPPAAPFVTVIPPKTAVREACEGPLRLSRSRHGNVLEPIEGIAATGRGCARLTPGSDIDIWAALCEKEIDAAETPDLLFAYRLSFWRRFRLALFRHGRLRFVDVTDGKNEDPAAKGARGFLPDGRWHRIRFDLLAILKAQEKGLARDWRFSLLGLGRSNEDATEGGEILLDDWIVGSFEGDSVSFEWSIPETPLGVRGYAWAFDHDAKTVPGDAVSGAEPRAAFRALPPGEWWFHVRAVDGGGRAGECAHARVVLERAPGAAATGAGEGGGT